MARSTNSIETPATFACRILRRVKDGDFWIDDQSGTRPIEAKRVCRSPHGELWCLEHHWSDLDEDGDGVTGVDREYWLTDISEELLEHLDLTRDQASYRSPAPTTHREGPPMSALAEAFRLAS